MVELNSLKSVWAFVFIFIHVDNLIKNSMSKYIWDAVHIVMKKYDFLQAITKTRQDLCNDHAVLSHYLIIPYQLGLYL